MEYTQDDLWQAVYTMIPSFEEVRNNGVYLNLPSCLDSAIIEWSMVRYRAEINKHMKLTFTQKWAGDILHQAKTDLECDGKFLPKELPPLAL